MPSSRNSTPHRFTPFDLVVGPAYGRVCACAWRACENQLRAWNPRATPAAAFGARSVCQRQAVCAARHGATPPPASNGVSALVNSLCAWRRYRSRAEWPGQRRHRRLSRPRSPCSQWPPCIVHRPVSAQHPVRRNTRMSDSVEHVAGAQRGARTHTHTHTHTHTRVAVTILHSRRTRKKGVLADRRCSKPQNSMPRAAPIGSGALVVYSGKGLL